ncbi:MAG: Methyltransferase type 12 [Candidatus Woesebacteria bacterium GW2011_GWB1_43_14]|uniref:Methyltransferase type 12 n=1 Tax=Candidatus Woesebacteria bacterium GW2011_GWB1_43_14 TaxID=1618578 RepID=A0A0G1DLR4_9BACT|nr:MAG: Methyltransferase type 12 [Candidatus Woesebacteria bacterium GW2011_GWC1_42_9]KKS98805.1 MAG: Methyltransferase type 12 [Candidatus Woesebacteria bacterium GW2011_GWB1_43_14]
MNKKKVKEYWDQRPCNIRHSPKPVGTVEYFNEVEDRRYFVEPHILQFAKFPHWKGKRVLEIGCGIGTDMIRFARTGAKVTAVEFSQKSLKIAKQRAKVFKLQNKIKFYQGDAEHLTDFVPIAPYDLVYSFGVIHHTPHPEKVIEQIRNYVRPGTVIKLMVYYRYSWRVFWILLTFGRGQFWRLNELVARHSEAQTGCPITHLYSRRQIRRLLHGYKIIEMHVDHIFPYRIADYTNYHYRKVWYFRWMPGPIFAWLKQNFGWHLLVTAEVY